MRLPNGYGSVYKMSGARRRPWVARKTTGWNDKGQPIYLYVGYYSSKAEALDGLARYNIAPHARKATFKEVFDLWWESVEPTLKLAVKCSYRSVMPRLAPLMKMRMDEIRLADMESLTRDETKFVGRNIKTVLGHVFTYAVHHELVTADRAELVKHITLSSEASRKLERRIFTEEEEAKVTEPEIIILLYTGLRIGELLALKAEDIHLDERWLYVRESKTSAGIRVVPIAERIVPLFSCLPATMPYAKIKTWFKKYGHLPHDTRHTFISRCADRGIDERVIKAIVGHSGSGITETVYTHLDLSVLLKAVNCL